MQKITVTGFNAELLERAYAAFKPTKIVPTTSKELIMFEAGAIKALDWLANEMSKKAHTTTIKNPHEHELPDSKEGLLRRMSKGSTND